MPIHTPGKVLLHQIPLKFVHNSVAGGGRKSLDMSIPLVPFIDFLITLVVFLLMSFSASGELVAQKPSITMPSAENAVDLEIAPILAIDAQLVTLDGEKVADATELAADAKVERIEALVTRLDTQRRNWEILHANEKFKGHVILQADKAVDFRVIKKVMFSAAQAGYSNISFAVNKKAK